MLKTLLIKRTFVAQPMVVRTFPPFDTQNWDAAPRCRYFVPPAIGGYDFGERTYRSFY